MFRLGATLGTTGVTSKTLGETSPSGCDDRELYSSSGFPALPYVAGLAGGSP